MTNRSTGEELTPALVERDCRRIMRSREVGENVQRMQTGRGEVEKEEQLGALGVLRREGKIDAGDEMLAIPLAEGGFLFVGALGFAQDDDDRG